jgi:hypothetical protein
MTVVEVAVALAEALPELTIADAVRQADNLRRAGLTVCTVERSGGWCDECACLYGDLETTRCRSCGYALLPVAFALTSWVLREVPPPRP